MRVTIGVILRAWKVLTPVLIITTFVLLLVAFAQIAGLRKKMHEVPISQSSSQTSTAPGPSLSRDDVIQLMHDMYDKLTADKNQVFYQGADLNVTLREMIFGEGEYGGLSRGSTLNPAIISYGPVYVRGPIILDGDTGDIKIWRSGQFISVAERLGLGNPDAIVVHPTSNEDIGQAAWTRNLCRGSIVGASCVDRHNWGVDSCVVETNTSLLCYCGGGYRDDITGLVHRHFLCRHSGDPTACLDNFKNTAPACCSPTDAAAGCTLTTATETICSISEDTSECCRSLPEDTCVRYGCVWTPSTQVCSFSPASQRAYDYIDLYAKCTTYTEGSVCDYQSRNKYLAMYNDYEACKASGTSAQACLLTARDRVNNAHWVNITLTNLYNWFDGGLYLIRNHAMQRPCLYAYLSISPAVGVLKKAFPAVWACDIAGASPLLFQQSPFAPERNYFKEQGRVAYILTRPPHSKTYYCLSSHLTKEYNITYHAKTIPSSNVLWVSVEDAEEWTMCAKVFIPSTISVSETFTTQGADTPLGFDKSSHGVRFTDTYNIAIEKHA